MNPFKDGSPESELFKRFMDTAVADTMRALDGGALIGALTLSICVLDYLARLSVGPTGKNGRTAFKAIVSSYLKAQDARYNPEHMYALRCSLVHTYGASDAMTEAGLTGFITTQAQPKVHLSELLYPKNTLQINVDSLVADVAWAAWEFLRAECADAGVRQVMNDQVAVAHKLYGSQPFATMHRALQTFDSDPPSRAQLIDAVYQILVPTV